MEEYNLPITGDISQLVRDLGTTKSSLSDTNKEAANASKSIKDGFDSATKSVEGTNRAMQQTVTAQNTLKRSQAELTDAIKFFQEKAFTEKDTSKVIAYNKQIESLGQELTKTKVAGTKGFDDMGNAISKNTNVLGKAFGALRLVANIIPGIGIAGILAFATGPIIEYISSLNLLNEKISQAILDRQALSEVTSKGVQNAQSELTTLRILYNEYQNANLPLTTRKEAYMELQKLYPEYFKNIDFEQKASKTTTDLYNQLTGSILATAQARAYADAITENAKRAVDNEIKTLELRNKQEDNNQKLLKIQAAQRDKIQGIASVSLGTTQAESKIGRENAAIAKEIADRKTDSEIVNKRNLVLETKINEQLQKGGKASGKVGNSEAFKQSEADAKKADKAADDAAKKKEARDKKVADEEVKLQNQITEALAKESDDKFELEKKAEDARFEVAKSNLEKQLKDFPELEKLINKTIEVERTAHGFRLAAIEIKQQKEREKIQSDGAKAIASVLKEDNQSQIDAVNQQFDDIIEKAKAANLYTIEVERKLAEQRAKAVNEVNIKSLTENNSKLLTIAISNVKTRQQKTGETDKEFELENQKAILGIKIDFAEKALSLIVNDKSKADQVAAIRENIAELKKQLKGVGNELDKEQSFSFTKSLQKAFKLSDNDFDGLKKGATAIIGLFNSVSDSIIEGYQREIDAGSERIDALKGQLDEAQSYFDEQNDLKQKGYANDADAAQQSVDAIKASLAQEEEARQQNIKNQQEAQKVTAAIRAIEIAASTTEQVVNLATAASKIFKAHAGIPFLGVVIALGAVAAMVAGFIAIKASIKSASAPTSKYKGGGKLKGNSHENDGVRYRSDDPHANIIELEGSEFIVNAASTRKHENLIEAINRDDFSKLKLNDYTLAQMLNATGVSEHKDIARNVGRDTVTKQNAFDNQVVIINNSSDKHLPKIEKHLAKLVKYEDEKEYVKDYPDKTVTRKGNVTTTVWKKK